jgi:hypothetical protein
MVILHELNEAAPPSMADDNNRHHHNSRQPPVVIELAAYPDQVPRQPAMASRQPPALLPTTVAERGPDSYSCSSGNALLYVRTHDSTCDARIFLAS